MIKIWTACLIVVGTASFASSASLWKDTKRYALSSLSFGYFQHVHNGEKEHEGVINIPSAAYGKISADTFVKFADRSNEVGVAFSLDVKQYLVVRPLVFHNIDQNVTGCGLHFALDLRKIRPW